VYPGGNSSIRFEKLREGIVDYEKIRILRETAGRRGEEKSRSLLTELEGHLGRLAAEPDYSKRNYDVPSILEALTRGRDLIQALSDRAGGE
jgi:hypothetical protein